MSPGPVMLGRLSATDAERRLRSAAGSEPTYAGPVGQTLAGAPPRHGFVLERVVGRGDAAFAAARQSLRTLAPQRAVAQVHPADATAVVGSDVIVAVPMGPLTVVATNRIVAVADEPGRFGFAYGTLPGHPEDGEEGFEVCFGPDGAVTARVIVDAVPALPFRRLLAPSALLVSRYYGHRYLAAIADAVNGGA